MIRWTKEGDRILVLSNGKEIKIGGVRIIRKVKE